MVDGMLNFITKLQIPTKILFGATFIVSSLMLFLPMSILSMLGLTGVIDEHRAIIGVCFLVSLAILILFLLEDIKHKINVKKRFKIRRKSLDKILNNPNSDECKLLYKMYKKGMQITIPKNSKPALYMESSGIITMPPQTTFLYYDGTVPVKYVVQPWASEIIEKAFAGR